MPRAHFVYGPDKSERLAALMALSDGVERRRLDVGEIRTPEVLRIAAEAANGRTVVASVKARSWLEACTIVFGRGSRTAPTIWEASFQAVGLGHSGTLVLNELETRAWRYAYAAAGECGIQACMRTFEALRKSPALLDDPTRMVFEVFAPLTAALAGCGAHRQSRRLPGCLIADRPGELRHIRALVDAAVLPLRDIAEILDRSVIDVQFALAQEDQAARHGSIGDGSPA